ncbi:MAG: YraN family protein [Planctomycetota bacterium]
MWPFGRPSPSLGQRGERLAARHLKRQGLKILARNYRCPVGEADLIALDRSTKRLGAETIVFVEVKSRSSDKYTDPESAVNADKKRRLHKVANYYVQRHDAHEHNVRFDIVAVLFSGDKPVVRHTPDAF